MTVFLFFFVVVMIAFIWFAPDTNATEAPGSSSTSVISANISWCLHGNLPEENPGLPYHLFSSSPPRCGTMQHDPDTGLIGHNKVCITFGYRTWCSDCERNRIFFSFFFSFKLGSILTTCNNLSCTQLNKKTKRTQRFDVLISHACQSTVFGRPKRWLCQLSSQKGKYPSWQALRVQWITSTFWYALPQGTHCIREGTRGVIATCYSINKHSAALLSYVLC